MISKRYKYELNFKGDAQSIVDLNELIKIENMLNLGILKVFNCYDYSSYCTNELNIHLYPQYDVYKNGKLINKLYQVPKINYLNRLALSK